MAEHSSEHGRGRHSERAAKLAARGVDQLVVAALARAGIPRSPEDGLEEHVALGAASGEHARREVHAEHRARVEGAGRIRRGRGEDPLRACDGGGQSLVEPRP